MLLGHVRKGTIALWLGHGIPNAAVPGSKPQGGSKFDSAFYLSEVDHMSTNNFWNLLVKNNCLFIVAL